MRFLPYLPHKKLPFSSFCSGKTPCFLPLGFAARNAQKLPILPISRSPFPSSSRKPGDRSPLFGSCTSPLFPLLFSTFPDEELFSDGSSPPTHAFFFFPLLFFIPATDGKTRLSRSSLLSLLISSAPDLTPNHHTSSGRTTSLLHPFPATETRLRRTLSHPTLPVFSFLQHNSRFYPSPPCASAPHSSTPMVALS